MHQVSQHIQNSEVVFDDNHALGFGQFLDDAHDAHTLVDVKIRRGFIKEIDINIPQNGCTNSHPLQLASRQLVNFTIEQMVDAKRFGHGIKNASFIHARKQFAHRPLNSFWQTVYILWFQRHADLPFLNSDEKVSQFTLGN